MLPILSLPVVPDVWTLVRLQRSAKTFPNTNADAASPRQKNVLIPTVKHHLSAKRIAIATLNINVPTKMIDGCMKSKRK